VRARAGVVAGGSRERPRPGAWRVLTPTVVLLSGSLFAVSAISSDGTDLRPGITDLTTLVSSEAEQYEQLRSRVESLTEEVNELTSRLADRDVARVQGRIEDYSDPAGLEPVEGEGVTITLTDSPLGVDETDQPERFLVVHQQDIQAVVNAMWRAGAEAVTIQGQRVVSTTGIKCEGPSVTLHGVPYPPPYVISAVGDPEEIADSVEGDRYLSLYRQQSAQEDIQIGWEASFEEEVEAPAYSGLLDLSYAEPIV
jgi:uncharacterized protein YlxW (UPF0749 family)